MIIDLSGAVPYLHALETARTFPDLFQWCEEHDEDHLLDEAMEEINKWCPHLWPYIDRQIVNIVSS